MIQLNRLEGFFWVAKTGGYSRAARAFPYPITQPAVFQQVKKLEGEIGVPLFERVGRDTLLLTPAGKKLYEFVTPFFGGLETLLESVRGGDHGGGLRIHASSMFLRHLLPAWLKRLQRRNPRISIDLQELTTYTCESLLAGEADLLVTYLPEVAKEVETRQVATLYSFLVFPATHRLAARARVTAKDFRDETFIGYTPGTVPYELQIQELAVHGVTPRRFVTATSADTILGFVESGVGFSLVPHLSTEGPKLRGIAARPLGTKRHRYPVLAAWRRSSAANPLLEAVLATAPR